MTYSYIQVNVKLANGFDWESMLKIWHNIYPLDQDPVRYIHDRCPTIGETEIRKVLGALGLQSDSHTRPIEKLSGGEKSRVVLAELSLNQYNVLFLDEPTNHLDTASAKAVAEAVNNFEGAVFAISHDATFVESVATHIIQCIDDHIESTLDLIPSILSFNKVPL